MKYRTLKQALDACPEKDKLFINGIEVSEEQFRWIQYCINAGILSLKRLKITDSQGSSTTFEKNGLLKETLKGNTLSFNRKLALQILL